MEFTPTDEQARIQELFDQGVGLAVEAGAGTGKSRTLRMLAESTAARGQYLAFNKAIVEEARGSMPSNVAVSTVHSLAYRAKGAQFSRRLKEGRMPSWKIAQTLRIEPLMIPLNGKTKVLQPGWLASTAMRAIERFCQTADEAPNGSHVAYVPGIDESLGSRHGFANNATLRDYLAPILVKAWADLQTPNGELPLGHAVYLKMYELDAPRIPVDKLFYDEAQDASPVMESIVRQQTHAQLIVVGDANQAIYCQPAGTLVRVAHRAVKGQGWQPATWTEVPIETLIAGDRVVSYDLPKSALRVTGCAVTSVTPRHYDGEMIEAKLPDGTFTRYTPDHHVITHVSDAFDGQFVVYVMRRGDQFRVGKATWRYKSQNYINGPVMRARAEGADALWVLSAHDAEPDALLSEALIAHRFNLPTWVFNGSNKHVTVVSEFWSSVGDNSAEGHACLTAFGRRADGPLWQRGDSPMFSKRPIVTRASNLMSGMRLLPADELVRDEHHRRHNGWRQAWQRADVIRAPYSGLIVSISVDEDHTYVADGIVTHNSFTGAVDALSHFKDDGAAYATLSQSFRFGPAIADVANLVLTKLDADLRMTGTETIDSRIGRLADEEVDAYLCRSNAGAVTRLLEMQKAGRPVHLLGGGPGGVELRPSGQAVDGRADDPASRARLLRLVGHGAGLRGAGPAGRRLAPPRAPGGRLRGRDDHPGREHAERGRGRHRHLDGA